MPDHLTNHAAPVQVLLGRLSSACRNIHAVYSSPALMRLRMLTDRYGLSLSTGSAAARDAYVEAADLALTFYPGAAEAYDRAIAADPRFALAHAGKAQVLMRQGDVAAARAALGTAKGVAADLSDREASHV